MLEHWDQPDRRHREREPDRELQRQRCADVRLISELGDDRRELRGVRDDGESPHEADRQGEPRRPLRDEPDRDGARSRRDHHRRRRLRPAPAVAEQSAGDAAERPGADHGEGRVRRARARPVHRAEEDDEPRPHRVQLPHVSEVAE